MQSIFEKLSRYGPSVFVLKAIVVAVIADVLLLSFILLRRGYRRWYFAKRDARVFELRRSWKQLISGEIPYTQWRGKAFDRRIVEEMVLDAFEGAPPEESAQLLKFLRSSGLIEKRIFEARQLTGWRRMRALVALGRTRAPEGIPALADALRDGNSEIRVAALRGLGRTACPQAAEEILSWVGEVGLAVPALALQSALIQCSGERPNILIPYVQQAEGPLREVLGRVLGEVATPSLALDLLPFVEDEREELRASAARAVFRAEQGVALPVLKQLAKDPVWFVRLRAIISLGRLSDPLAIPSLILGLQDSNRLVRLRAAEALVEFDRELVRIFVDVLDTGDRYGLHAFLTALDNASLRGRLEEEIRGNAKLEREEKSALLDALATGILPSETPRTETELKVSEQLP